MHVTLGVTAQTTMYAVIRDAYLSLCPRAVHRRVRGVGARPPAGPTGEWSAISQRLTEQQRHGE